MKSINYLREKYPIFNYQDYKWSVNKEDLVVRWSMTAGEIMYHPEIKISSVQNFVKTLDKKIIDNFVFNLGLAEIPSYWKATCSPIIKISAGFLDEWQIQWWKNLYTNGMGQYFYENQIDFRGKDFIKIESVCERFWTGPVPYGNRVNQNDDKDIISTVNKNKILVAVGGGKDSAVALELLADAFDIYTFILNPASMPAAQKVIQTAGIKRILTVERKIDPVLLSLNHKGYLNGHTPFSSYLAFLSIFLGYLFGVSSVVFANERSANEGNLKYLGNYINHQYSKSFAFEESFREYNKKYLSSINYFSFLRPLYELQIAKMFTKMDKYFLNFNSCNRGRKKNIWCGECAKCLSVYISLYPFISFDALLSIFGYDLFGNKKLLPLFMELVGEGKHKPFECVGTFAETIVALHLCILKNHSQKELPILLASFVDKVLPKYKNIKRMTKDILTGWDNNNNLSENYQNILKQAYANS